MFGYSEELALRLRLRTDHDSLLVVDEVLEDGGSVESGEDELFSRLCQPQSRLGFLLLLVIALRPDFQGSRLIPEFDYGAAHDYWLIAAAAVYRLVGIVGKAKDGPGAWLLFETHLTSFTLTPVNPRTIYLYADRYSLLYLFSR